MGFWKDIIKARASSPKIVVKGGGGGRSEHRKGYLEERGKLKARIPLVRNPFLTTIIIIIFYLFLSIWPYPIFPFIGIEAVVWIGIILWLLLARKGAWVIVFVMVFAIIYSAFFSDIFGMGEIWSEDLKSKVKFVNPIDYLKSLAYGSVGDWRNPQVEEEVVKKGVEFVSFKSDDIYYGEDEPISLTAKVKIDGFYDPVSEIYQKGKVEFSCYEENSGEEGKILADYEDKDYVEVPARELSNYDVICSFEKGLKVVTGTVVDAREVDKLKIVMTAKMKFSQIGSVNIWNVLSENEPEDFIREVGSDPYLTKDGRSKSKCKLGCGGPYKLSISTGLQPITEKKKPKIEVKLEKDPNIYGMVTKIHDVALVYPEGIGFALITEGMPCDFEGDRIKQTVLDDKNKEIEKANSEEKTPIINFKCNYKLETPLDRLGFKSVEARIIYDVVVRKRTIAEVYKEAEIDIS